MVAKLKQFILYFVFYRIWHITQYWRMNSCFTRCVLIRVIYSLISNLKTLILYLLKYISKHFCYFCHDIMFFKVSTYLLIYVASLAYNCAYTFSLSFVQHNVTSKGSSQIALLKRTLYNFRATFVGIYVYNFLEFSSSYANGITFDIP